MTPLHPLPVTSPEPWQAPTPHDWLKQFLAWITPLNFGFACLLLVAAFITQDHFTALAGLVLLAGSGTLLLAHRYVNRGASRQAVELICFVLLSADVVVALVLPELLALLVVPLIGIVLVLPYLQDKALRRWMVAAWLVTLLVAGIRLIHRSNTQLPPWFITLFSIASLGATIILIYLLLWQYHHRLTLMLRQTQEAEERYSRAAAGANDGLWDWNLVTQAIYYSPRWKAMAGYGEDDIKAHPDAWMQLIHAQDVARVKAEIAVHLDGLTPHFVSEYRLLCADGRYRWMLARGLAAQDGTGRAVRLAGSQTDMTRQKQSEEQLRHAALHDALTGLPNLRMFSNNLRRALATVKKNPQRGFAVLFFDLDRFKYVNDSLGHGAGDELLIAVGKRIQAVLQGPQLLARLGGDEFVALIENLESPKEVVQIADLILATFNEPFILGGVELFTSVSIGITYSTLQHQQPEELISEADSALYEAKAKGKGRWAFFHERLHAKAVTFLSLEAEIRRALQQEELRVAYQPIVDLVTGEVLGFEALMRWQHPELGLLPPSRFQEVAEEAGLLKLIDIFVLRTACQQVAQWQHRAAPPVIVSVNLSAQLFSTPSLVEVIQQQLRASGIAPEQLWLELTEDIIMSEVPDAGRRLNQLRQLGVRLYVDDFGTGYSSLSKLYQIVLDGLKMDRFFLSKLPTATTRAPIPEVILNLAQTMALDVVAEGIETVAQLDYLRQHGCPSGQGFLFAPAVPATEATALLNNTTLPWAKFFPQQSQGIVQFRKANP